METPSPVVVDDELILTPRLTFITQRLLWGKAPAILGPGLWELWIPTRSPQVSVF